MRLEFATNCDRSSMCSPQTDPVPTHPSDWTSSNKRPLAQEQLRRLPAKMLEAQPVMTALIPLPTWRHLGDLCVNLPKPKSRSGIPLPQIPESAGAPSCCHRVSACPKGNGSHIDLLCGPVQYPQHVQHGLSVLSCPQRRIPLTRELDIQWTDVR